jgi:hypothetical protein
MKASRAAREWAPTCFYVVMRTKRPKALDETAGFATLPSVENK